MNIHIGLLSELPPEARTVILIGNRQCDHLRELVRMAEYKGRAAYRIESADELQPRWFVGAGDVGIVLGAEDLESMVHEVMERLDRFAAAESRGMLEGVAR